jgi:nickel/cobalt exporter
MCGPRWNLLYFLCLLCVSVVSPSFAHPVPKDNHDRTIVVHLNPNRVAVQYRLEVDGSLAQLEVARFELPAGEFARLTTPQAIGDTFARHLVPTLAGNLLARLDGKPLAFTGEVQRVVVEDHLRCEFLFQATWSPSPGRPHSFDFREGNYEPEDFDHLHLTLTAGGGVTIERSVAPDESLLARPPLERKPGDNERLRKVSANFVIADEASPTVEHKPAPPPEDDTATLKPVPGLGHDHAGSSDAHRLLSLLLDTRHGLAVLLLLAGVFGAVHALTPGHGKTLVAAYLVGEQGTVWHALLLGLMTTLAHTGAVFLLAVLFLLAPKTAGVVYFLQGLVGGLLIAGLGLWLLLRRLGGQPDHFHFGGHHHHHHDHTHADHHHGPVLPPGETVRWWHLALLGLQGGMVPCVDAVILLCLAISAQRLWLGLPLLLAFSAGLAGVLVVLGVGVVYARNWAVARWGERPGMQKLVRMLPIVSAALITLMGLWLCSASLHP